MRPDASRPAAAEALAAFRRAARRGGWRWYVFGAQAVVAYGRPRMTADVDVAVDLAGAKPSALVAELARAGLALRFPFGKRRLADARLLPVVHRATSLPVDVMITGPGLDDEFLARA